MRSKRQHNFIQGYPQLHLCILLWIFPAILIFNLLIPARAYSQDQPDYEEISVGLHIQQLGNVEITAIVRENKAYLPVNVLFDYLKIKNDCSRDFDTVSGFFITQDAVYLIDQKHHRITFREKIFELQPNDLIITEEGVFLALPVLSKVFGLNCTFSFRNLMITLTTKAELPVIREMRQEELRRNLRYLKGEGKADTVLKRKHPVFHFGMADWSVIATEMLRGPYNVRVNLGLGGVIAGGETNILLNYSNGQPFTEKDQFYLWRYADNSISALRQISIGKITTQATSSIYSPVVGAQFTNTPTTYRRAFGTYTLSDHTEPGWIVELYVNNVLVNFVKADPSGLFTFEVPLVYGNSMVKLRFYGPWGEEKTKETNINIPYNFLPLHELEYTVSGGMVENGIRSIYSRANLNYGLAKRLTVGAGVEYLSSVTSGPIMPFANLSLRIASSLLISAEYTYGVRFKGTLNYSLPSSLQVELDYTRYHQGQTAINFNYLEERKAIVSMPVRAPHLSFFMRLTLDQIILPSTNYTTAEFVLSGAVFGVGTNLTTYAIFPNPGYPNVYSNLSLGFRFRSGFTLTPQAQFDYNQLKFISAKCELEKRLFKQLYATLSYEQIFASQVYNIQFGIRYDFPAAHAELLVKQSNQLTTLFQSARGSLICDAKSKYLDFNNRVNVGRGGLVLAPFLDLNQNGKRDTGEPKVGGLTFSINGGRIEVDTKDTITRVFDLEPYVTYVVELNRNSFENIAWQIRNHTLAVTVEPNTLKMIDIPVTVAGEASGTVSMKSSHGIKGQGRIVVCFYRNDSVMVARTITEQGGFFSYLGLPPGSFTVRMDTMQLGKLQMTPVPAGIPFTIKKSTDGDVVDGLDFVLQPNEIRKESSVFPVEGHKMVNPDSASVKSKAGRADSPQLLKVKMLPVPSGIPLKLKKNAADNMTNMPVTAFPSSITGEGLSQVPAPTQAPGKVVPAQVPAKAPVQVPVQVPVKAPGQAPLPEQAAPREVKSKPAAVVSKPVPLKPENTRDTVDFSPVVIRITKINAIAFEYYQQRQYAKAIHQFEQARKIAAANTLKVAPVYDSLYHRSYKLWLLEQISLGQKLIGENKTDSALKFFQMAAATARLNGLEGDPEIRRALALYNSRLSITNCKMIEEGLAEARKRSVKCIAQKDYKQGVTILQSAIDEVGRISNCNPDINFLKDTINKYKDAAEYQINLESANRYLASEEYEKGFQLLTANDKLYASKSLYHFGIPMTTAYDFVMLKANATVSMQALEHFIANNEPEEALRYLRLLHTQGIFESLSNYYQEKLARILAAKDKMANERADPLNMVLRYTSSNAWMSRFTEVYIESWKK